MKREEEGKSEAGKGGRLTLCVNPILSELHPASGIHHQGNRIYPELICVSGKSYS